MLNHFLGINGKTFAPRFFYSYIIRIPKLYVYSIHYIESPLQNTRVHKRGSDYSYWLMSSINRDVFMWTYRPYNLNFYLLFITIWWIYLIFIYLFVIQIILILHIYYYNIYNRIIIIKINIPNRKNFWNFDYQWFFKNIN